MTKNAFYFALKTIFVHNFFLEFFGYVEKQLDKKTNANFKIFNVTS